MIRNLFKSLCCVLVLVLVLTSCETSFLNKGFSEVDFNKGLSVQLNFNDNVYNGEVSLNEGELNIDFKGNEGFPDGLKYSINREYVQISFMGMNKKIPVEKLQIYFMPLVLYKFVVGFDGPIITDSYNTQKECAYICRDISGANVTLEVYENQENTAYSLYIK